MVYSDYMIHHNTTLLFLSSKRNTHLRQISVDLSVNRVLIRPYLMLLRHSILNLMRKQKVFLRESSNNKVHVVSSINISMNCLRLQHKERRTTWLKSREQANKSWNSKTRYLQYTISKNQQKLLSSRNKPQLIRWKCQSFKGLLKKATLKIYLILELSKNISKYSIRVSTSATLSNKK